MIRTVCSLSFVVLALAALAWAASSVRSDTANYHYPYAHLQTKHFDIYVESDSQGALAPSYPNIESALEYGWSRYQRYTGYDLDDLANAATTGGFEKPKYIYEFLNPADMWEKGWGGGLTAWNHSQMGNELVPDLTAAKAAKDSGALGVMWHELGNGWSNVVDDYKGQGSGVPGWWGNEGHAGFMKQHALMDSGYPTAAVAEYTGAVKIYDQYIADHKAGGASKADPGSITHVLLESIWQKYGWRPERYIDRMVQTGRLILPHQMPDADRNGEFVFYLCHAVKQNLLPFMDENYIEISPDWRQKIEALDYPPGNIPIARDLDADKPDPRLGNPFGKP